MKVYRVGEHFSKLEESQMQEIDKLQEQIKLFEFDKSKDKQKIRILKQKLSRRNNTINSVIQELELMRKEENYKRLLIITNILKSITKEDYNE